MTLLLHLFYVENAHAACYVWKMNPNGGIVNLWSFHKKSAQLTIYDYCCAGISVIHWCQAIEGGGMSIQDQSVGLETTMLDLRFVLGDESQISICLACLQSYPMHALTRS